MTIHLNSEQERVIGQAIQAGVIRDADDVVDAGLEAIRQRLEAQLASTAAMDAEQWSQELHAWFMVTRLRRLYCRTRPSAGSPTTEHAAYKWLSFWTRTSYCGSYSHITRIAL